MIFSSTVFLFYFLPIFLLLYYLTPGRFRAFVITGASYVFYGWWRPSFVALMLFSTVVDYGCGAAIRRAQDRGDAHRGRPWLVLSIITNLGLLAWFKYANFGIDTANQVLEAAGYDSVRWTETVLPVGISFYTFQTMSYTIDVYRGTAPPVGRFRDFMAYVALFPQLVAGPIVRYGSVADQLRTRKHSIARFGQGALLFQIGLAKKILLADTLGEVADRAFDGPVPNTVDAWTGLVAYAFQIYFDFSGYSDMAIGLGLMIGFRFPINFDSPYRSKSITEFWRRWHISLSAWLRDYLYLSLGGNRRGHRRTYINLMLVMLLGGLWHGAAWTFIAWGAWHGAWLAFERMLGKRSFYATAPRVVRVVVTFGLVLLGWVFFRANSLTDAVDYLQALFGWTTADFILEVRRIHWVALVIGAAIVWTMPTSQALASRPRTLVIWLVQVLFAWAIIHFFQADDIAFLYYRF